MSRGHPDNWKPETSRTKPYYLLVTTSTVYTEASPLLTTWTLEKGVLVRFEIYFPDGCKGVHRVAVFDGTTQILPEGSGSFRGNEISFILQNLNYPLIISPYQLTVKSWNVSPSNYDHGALLYMDVSKYD
jgi:hypothetical protein